MSSHWLSSPCSSASEQPCSSPAEPPGTSASEQPCSSPAEPPGTSASEQPCSSSAEPPGTSASEQPCSSSAEPPGTSASEQPCSSPAEPPGTSASEQPCSSPAEPPGTSASEQPCSSSAEPPGTSASKPSSSSESKPPRKRRGTGPTTGEQKEPGIAERLASKDTPPHKKARRTDAEVGSSPTSKTGSQGISTEHSKMGPSFGRDRGTDYEKILHAYCALKAFSLREILGQVRQTFEEPGMGDQTDDLALRYSLGDDENLILFQSKHEVYPSGLTLAELRGGSGGYYSLAKYCQSYEKAKMLALKEKRNIQHVVLFTNRPFNSANPQNVDTEVKHTSVLLTYKFQEVSAELTLTEVKIDDLARPLRELLSFDEPGHQKFYKFADDQLKQNLKALDSQTYPFYKEKEGLQLEFLQKFIFAMSQPNVEGLTKEVEVVIGNLATSFLNLSSLKGIDNACKMFSTRINQKVRGRDGVQSPEKLVWTSETTEKELNFLVVNEASNAIQQKLTQHMDVSLTSETPGPLNVNHKGNQIILTEQIFTCAQLVMSQCMLPKNESGSIQLMADDFNRFAKLGVFPSCVSVLSSSSKALILIHDKNTSKVSLLTLELEIVAKIPSQECQVILLTNEDRRENAEGFLVTKYDVPSKNLGEETIQKILDTNVKFQGQDYSFKDIVALEEEDAEETMRSVLDPNTIEKLVKGNLIKIGSNVAEDVRDENKLGGAVYREKFYINRRLQRLTSDTTNVEDKDSDQDDVLKQAMVAGKYEIISAPAGMGKSTFLSSVCVRIKEKHPEVWVLFCDLKNDWTNRRQLFFDMDTQTFALDDLENPASKSSLLLKGLFPEDLGSKLELNILAQKLKDPRKVTLLFDSFDEIECSDKFLELISILGNPLVWIVTRKPVNDQLFSKLEDAQKYDLQDLNTAQQQKFLNEFKLKVSDLQRYLHPSFLRNPLQLSMVVEVLSNLTEDAKLNLTPYTLYERVVDQKFNKFLHPLLKDPGKDACKRLIGWIKPKMEVDHQQLALVALFRDKWSSYVGSAAPDLEVLLEEGRKANFGLIRNFADQKPIFVHDTYADFFVSTFIYSTIQEISKKSLIRKLLKKVSGDEKCLEVCRFLDDKLVLAGSLKISRRDLCYKSSIKSAPETARLPALYCFLWDKRTFFDRDSRKQDTINEMHKLFIDAVACCNIAFVEKVLEDPDFDVSKQYDDDVTALHVACSLTRNRPYAEAQEGMVQRADPGDLRLRLVQLLIDKGSSRGIVNTADKYGLTALHFAVEVENESLVDLLLTEGSDVLAKTNDKKSPLHIAAERGCFPVADLLIAKGSDVDAQTEDKLTPLHFAAERGFLRLVDLLLTRVTDVDVKTVDKRTPLHFAAEFGNEEVVKKLLAKGSAVNAEAIDRRTPLHYAAELGNDRVVKLLLAGGCAVDAVTDSRKTALHFAAEHGNEEVVDVLLENGSDVNAPSEDGLAALHLAARIGNESMSRLLVSRGSDVNAATNDGHTAAHFAAKSSCLPLVKVLQECECNFLAVTHDEWTVLHYAARGTVPIVNHLLAMDCDVNAETSKGKTALHLAAAQGSPAVVKRLLSQARNIHAKTRKGWTALHFAAKRGSDIVAKQLLNNNLEINAKTMNGMTALMLAAQKGSLPVVKLLLCRGCDVTARADDGKAAIDFAEAEGNKHVSNRINEALKMLHEVGNDSHISIVMG